MRLKHLKRGYNISNAFETFATGFEYSQRVLNIYRFKHLTFIIYLQT